MKFPNHHDFVWLPSLEALTAFGRSRELNRVLLLGEPTAVDLEAREVRVAPMPESTRCHGVFVFRRGQRHWDALVGIDARDARAWSRTLEGLRPGDPELTALARFDNEWGGALPCQGHRTAPAFAIGSYVRISGSQVIARVEGAEFNRAGWQYDLVANGNMMRYGEKSLEPAEIRLNDPTSWLLGPSGGADDLSLTLTHTKLSNPLADVLYSYGSTRTVFRPYQFRPILRLLHSASQRLLIADEVGLGKTIEAGLVWTELDQRIGIRRGLVVCPSNLVSKWRDEMLRRFDRELVVLDKGRLLELVEWFERGDNRPFAGVVSLERLRSDDLLPRMTEAAPHFDLVIVDEAHALRNQTTRSYDLGALLSDWADVILFLSATPVNLRSDDLFNLLHLLAPEEFPDRETFRSSMEPNRHLNAAARELVGARSRPRSLLPHLHRVTGTSAGAVLENRPEFELVRELLDRDEPLTDGDIVEVRAALTELNTLSSIFSRTRKAEVPDAKARRQAIQIDVEWSAAELDAYNAVLHWARRRAIALDHPVGFSTMMPLRQAASCLPAMRQLLNDRHPELHDLDDNDDPVDEDYERSYDFDTEQLIRELRTALTSFGDTDTKFDRFVEQLHEVHERLGVSQVLVFSFFKRTLSYLERRLTELGYRVGLMNGSVPMARRVEIMEEFRRGAFEILLLSEVGSEGLDFEFCGALFNYDLPWNPMRVEQRIGRLDRFGQRHERIYIFNFHVPGTIETDIFERLYERIRVFEESIGELEPILQDEISELTRKVLDPRLDDSEKAAEAERVGIALEQRRRQVEELEAADAMLAGIDGLLVDGLEKSIEAGRYVSGTELERLLRRLIDGTGSSLRRDRSNDILVLRGDEDLASRVTRWAKTGSAGRTDPGTVARRIRAREELLVTFEPERAAVTTLELLHPRHPLITAAVGLLDEEPHSLARLAGVRVVGSPAGHYLVLFALVDTTGVRPAIELASVAVDLATHEVVPGIGDLVLSASAKNELQDGSRIVPAEARTALAEAQVELDVMRETLRDVRLRRNEAIVDSQAEIRRTSFDFKIRRAREMLSKAIAEGHAESVRRLHEGRIRNLEHDKAAALARLEERRALAVGLRPAVVALVEVVTE